jgi:hypothetical protein
MPLLIGCTLISRLSGSEHHQSTTDSTVVRFEQGEDFGLGQLHSKAPVSTL